MCCDYPIIILSLPFRFFPSYAYICRYRTADIPKANDNEIENFLMQVYEEKDELIDSYLKTRGNSFTENNNFKKFPVSIVYFIQHEGKLMAKNGNALYQWLSWV